MPDSRRNGSSVVARSRRYKRVSCGERREEPGLGLTVSRFVGIADDRSTIRGGPGPDDKIWRNKGDKRTEMETIVEDRGTVYTARRTVKIKRKINC